MRKAKFTSFFCHSACMMKSWQNIEYHIVMCYISPKFIDSSTGHNTVRILERINEGHLRIFPDISLDMTDP